MNSGLCVVDLDSYVVNDPLVFLKEALKRKECFLGARPSLNSLKGGSEQYLIVFNRNYARFSFVQGKYPSMRSMGIMDLNGDQPLCEKWTPCHYAHLPNVLRHALAGWLLVTYRQGLK